MRNEQPRQAAPCGRPGESQVEAVPSILNPGFFDCKTGRSYQKFISKVIPVVICG